MIKFEVEMEHDGKTGKDEMMAAFGIVSLLVMALNIFKFVVLVLVLLCCIKYLKG